MRIILTFVVLLLSGCASVKTYEEIVENSLDVFQSDNITYHVNSWVPFSAPDNATRNDEDVKNSERDVGLCVDEYRGVEFKDEAFSMVYFMQCMNKKGWRLHTEQVMIIGH